MTQAWMGCCCHGGLSVTVGELDGGGRHRYKTKGLLSDYRCERGCSPGVVSGRRKFATLSRQKGIFGRLDFVCTVQVKSLETNSDSVFFFFMIQELPEMHINTKVIHTVHRKSLRFWSSTHEK